MSDEIAREIDRIIIDEAVGAAGAGNTNWTKLPPAGDTTTRDKRAYAATLYEAIVDSSNLVYKLRYKRANWAVCNPDTAARLEKLEEFRLSPDGDDRESTIDRHYLGTLARRFKVYSDPWFQADTMLMGYKGSSWIDAGLIYSPYVSAAVLTNSYVAGTVKRLSRGTKRVALFVTYDKQSSTSLEMKVEFSVDNSNYVQQPGESLFGKPVVVADADSSYGAPEQNLLNELKGKYNDLVARLDSSQLMVANREVLASSYTPTTDGNKVVVVEIPETYVDTCYLKVSVKCTGTTTSTSCSVKLASPVA
jgi:hypothetical protein